MYISVYMCVCVCVCVCVCFGSFSFAKGQQAISKVQTSQDYPKRRHADMELRNFPKT